MAALTLEVYYRYLRLYDRPSLPSDPESIVPLTTPDAGPRLRPPR